MGRPKSQTPLKNRRTATAPTTGKRKIRQTKATQRSKEGSVVRQKCSDWLSTQSSSSDRSKHPQQCTEDLEATDSETEIVESAEQRRLNAKTKYKVNMLCEWHTCKAEFATFDDFKLHCVTHLEKLQTDNVSEGFVHSCHWDLCIFKTEHAHEFRMHFHYHLYHTNLKTFGERLLLNKKVPPCLLDSMRRNCIPDITSEYACQWLDCEQKFESICIFLEHVRKHCVFERSMCSHSLPSITCNWSGCGKTYEKQSRLTDHLRIHVHDKLMACPHCGSTFMSYAKFYMHFNRQGAVIPEQYQCVHCFRNFYSEDLLNTHKDVHVNRYKCSMCDMTCPSPSALALHVRYRHITEKPYKCLQCEFSAVLKQELDKHILVTHEKHLYECDVFGCNFSTHSLYMMRKHYRSVHEDTPNVYCCHCCSARFNKGHQLSKHLIRHHKFELPSGHSRFTYRREMDGVYRLQLMRLESLEVSQLIMSKHQNSAVTPQTDGTRFTVSDVKLTSKGELSVLVVPSHKIVATAAADEVGSAYEEALSMPDLRDSDDSDADRMDGRGHVVQRTSKSYLRRSTRKRRHVNDAADTFKNIKEFSVMKRYLETVEQSQIMIEVNDVDEAGNVVSSQMISADEIKLQ